MLKPTSLLAAAIAASLALASCTGSEAPAPPSSQPSSSPSPTPTEKEPTPAQRASQLTRMAPTTFDATYRLTSKGKNRPDPKVRIRMDERRFRLDLQQGRATSVLLTGGRGVVSCRIEAPAPKSDRNAKSKVCYLVSGGLPGVPGLFDPALQRLFRSIRTEISRGSKQLRVKGAKPWKAPKPLGTSECFLIRGKGVESGTYCFLSQRGPFIGLLARVTFPSGNLSIREVKRVVRKGTFLAPARPTPLPD